eukprot:m.47819 g.47819  ORF g.47819 m.47819 type:complete len:52 (-) comp7360_c2_seq1:130-285(-)
MIITVALFFLFDGECQQMHASIISINYFFHRFQLFKYSQNLLTVNRHSINT